ncbi:MAG: glycosyltransferase family 2 protein [Phycisphaerae bacterium]|nr:glycosyltransferase family 2 protein [Phycisphaerae bacterium]
MLGLSIVILSFNRREALARTLSEVRSAEWGRSAQVIVVDNASSDGSAEMVRREFPMVELLALERNTAIAGFNLGAARATREVVLILDDDSWPREGAMEGALAYLESHPEVGGIMLHRRHPRSLAPEWPFDQPDLAGVQTEWPDMGCGNIVRRGAWNRVGGYEERFHLYRNDTDLALKLLGAGCGVVFNPAWEVWHDSAVVTRKSNKWLRLSTRNWVWMARRHAAGWPLFKGILLGWLHAHRLAGWRPRGHWSVLRGLSVGLMRPAPHLPPGLHATPGRFASLIRLKSRYRAPSARS